MLRIAITGAAGRMGRRLAALAIESGRFDLAAAIEAGGHEAIGRDVGELAGAGTFGVEVTSDLPPDVEIDVLIDFSLPDGTMKFLPVCRSRKVAAVIGTTGLTASQQAEVADAASEIAVVQAANFSIGVNVLLKVVAGVAAALGSDYDVEVVEAHHRFKKDAPSGTAIALARSVCEATGRDYGSAAVLGRGGHCPRKAGEIGMHAVRLGDTVGEHAVYFGGLGETVYLGHSAHTRDTFARVALRAAEWVRGKQPGLYDMQDVLALR
ncbi:MAG: 4-hydroxy-tetrahydrodipicolinate reductase [Planctomycetes bacterium]|nr:4-hydroxy-tetrahydrodipicolinate reductase [Planctomycetota bacterium]